MKIDQRQKACWAGAKGLAAARIQLCLAFGLAWFAVSGVCRAAEPSPESPPGQQEGAGEERGLLPFHVSGSASVSAVGRFTGNDQDFDLRGSFSLLAGDPLEDTINAFLSASLNLDLDGGSTTYGYNVYEGYEDAFQRAFFGQLLEARIDLNRLLPLVGRIRLGRQFAENFHGMRFDGVSLSTDDMEPLPGVKISAGAFGGLPVHIFEDEPWGDGCAGASLRVVAARALHLGLHFVWVRDRSLAWGNDLDNRSTRFTVNGSFRPGPAFSCSGHVTFMDLGTSDLQMVPEECKLAARSHLESLKLTLRAEFLARLTGAADTVAEFNPYEPVLGDSGLYQRGRMSLSWLPADEFEISITGSAYNSDFDGAGTDTDMGSARLTVMFKDLPFDRVTFLLAGEIFDLSGSDYSAGVNAEIGYKFVSGEGSSKRKLADVRISGGYCPFTRSPLGSELRERVVSAGLDVRWWPVKGLRLGVDFGFENDEFDAYYKVGLKAEVNF